MLHEMRLIGFELQDGSFFTGIRAGFGNDLRNRRFFEKRCADFAASLISQIKLKLKEQKIPETTAQESIEAEQKDETSGSETPTSTDEGDKQKEYFRHVQRIRNAYRKVAKNPLASRRKIS